MRKFLTVLCLLLTAAPSIAADKIRVSVQIACSDRDAAGKLAAAFTKAFGKVSDYELVDSLPQAKLVIYANRDSNSAKNPNGWSVAIARVSNTQTYYAASKLADTQQSDALAVKQVIAGMMQEEGFLKNLNVAHLDELSDATVEVLAEAVTAAFFKDLAGGTKR